MVLSANEVKMKLKKDCKTQRRAIYKIVKRFCNIQVHPFVKLIRYGGLSIRIYRQIGRKSFGQGATTSDKAFSNFPEQVSITATRDTWFLLLCKDRQMHFAFPGRIFPSFTYNYLHSTCTCPSIFTTFFVFCDSSRVACSF